MALFYKGVAVGTHLHAQNLRLTGLGPRSLVGNPGVRTLMAHITHGTTTSGYISLTRSYGVAKAYALSGTTPPTPANPGHVYEVEINDPLPAGLTLVDPLCEIAVTLNNPRLSTYHHDGNQNLLLGIVDPATMRRHLTQFVADPPNSGRIQRQPHISLETEALVRTLRDAEILVSGNIPSGCFVERHDVF